MEGKHDQRNTNYFEYFVHFGTGQTYSVRDASCAEEVHLYTSEELSSRGKEYGGRLLDKPSVIGRYVFFFSLFHDLLIGLCGETIPNMANISFSW